MYRHDMKTQILLDAVAASGAGNPTALPPGRKIFLIAQSSTPTATVKIQGSVDGSTWDDIYSHATTGTAATKTIEVDDIYPKHRANVSAYTAGTISVTCGFPVVN